MLEVSADAGHSVQPLSYGEVEGVQLRGESSCLSLFRLLYQTGFDFEVTEISQHSEAEVSSSGDGKICKLQALCMHYFLPEKLNLAIQASLQ